MLDKLDIILNELRSLRDALNSGFCDSAEGWPRRISIGPPKDYEGACSWHYWDGSKSVVIDKEFLKGRITKVRIDDSEQFKNNPVEKLLVTVQCGLNFYELRSGADNVWSRGFYLSVLAATPHQLNGSVNIQARPCRDKETRQPTGSTFCTLFSGSIRIRTEYREDANFDSIRQCAISKIQRLTQSPDIHPLKQMTNLEKLRMAAQSVGAEDDLIKMLLSQDYPGMRTNQLSAEQVLHLEMQIRQSSQAS